MNRLYKNKEEKFPVQQNWFSVKQKILYLDKIINSAVLEILSVFRVEHFRPYRVGLPFSKYNKETPVVYKQILNIYTHKDLCTAL